MTYPNGLLIAIHHHSWSELQREFDFHPDEIALVERRAEEDMIRHRRQGFAIVAIMIAGGLASYAGLNQLALAVGMPLLMVGAASLGGGIAALRHHNKISQVSMINSQHHWSADPEALEVLPAYGELLKVLPARHDLIPQFLRAARDLHSAEASYTVTETSLEERLDDFHPVEVLEKMIEGSEQRMSESADSDMRRLLNEQIKRLQLEVDDSSRIEAFTASLEARRKRIKEAKRTLHRLAVQVAETRRNERQLEEIAREVAQLSSGHIDTARASYDELNDLLPARVGE